MGNILDKAGLKTYTAKVKTAIANAVAEVKLYFTTQSVTWSELKALRDAKKLVAGKTYRITDFVTTTAQADTRSAGHAFDLLVVADDAGTLNENARAVLHSGDTYFAQSNLSAWRLMYCLDNDDTRFAWADTENGKGVIFRMIDEWENDVPYDFKNIQFKRYKVTAYIGDHASQEMIDAIVYNEDTQPYYFGVKDINTESIYPNDFEIDENAYEWFFTFAGRGSDNEFFDGSLKDVLSEAEKTALREYGWSNVGVSRRNEIGSLCKRYIMDDYYYSMRSLNDIVLYGEMQLTLNAEGGIDNVNGDFPNSNRFASDCYYNTFGNDCYYNTFGNDCYSNTFGNDCYSNTFGNSCRYNTFGNYCYSNTFGNSCRYNTFGNNCNYNTFGNDCYYNTFGNYLYANTFGDGVQYIKIADGTNAKKIQYCIVLNGTQGVWDSNLLSIAFVAGVNYTQHAGKDSSGNLKIFTLADLVQ